MCARFDTILKNTSAVVRDANLDAAVKRAQKARNSGAFDNLEMCEALEYFAMVHRADKSVDGFAAKLRDCTCDYWEKLCKEFRENPERKAGFEIWTALFHATCGGQSRTFIRN